MHVLPKTGKGGGRVEEEEAEIGDGKGRVERKGRVGLEEGTKEKKKYLKKKKEKIVMK